MSRGGDIYAKYQPHGFISEYTTPIKNINRYLPSGHIFSNEGETNILYASRFGIKLDGTVTKQKYWDDLIGEVVNSSPRDTTGLEVNFRWIDFGYGEARSAEPLLFNLPRGVGVGFTNGTLRPELGFCTGKTRGLILLDFEHGERGSWTRRYSPSFNNFILRGNWDMSDPIALNCPHVQDHFWFRFFIREFRNHALFVEEIDNSEWVIGRITHSGYQPTEKDLPMTATGGAKVWYSTTGEEPLIEAWNDNGTPATGTFTGMAGKKVGLEDGDITTQSWVGTIATVSSDGASCTVANGTNKRTMAFSTKRTVSFLPPTGSMTEGSEILTMSAGIAIPEDVGTWKIVYGAGQDGDGHLGCCPVLAKVEEYISPTQVKLDQKATVTVTDVPVVWGAAAIVACHSKFRGTTYNLRTNAITWMNIQTELNASLGVYIHGAVSFNQINCKYHGYNIRAANFMNHGAAIWYDGRSGNSSSLVECVFERQWPYLQGRILVTGYATRLKIIQPTFTGFSSTSPLLHMDTLGQDSHVDWDPRFIYSTWTFKRFPIVTYGPNVKRKQVGPIHRTLYGNSAWAPVAGPHSLDSVFTSSRDNAPYLNFETIWPCIPPCRYGELKVFCGNYITGGTIAYRLNSSGQGAYCTVFQHNDPAEHLHAKLIAKNLADVVFTDGNVGKFSVLLTLDDYFVFVNRYSALTRVYFNFLFMGGDYGANIADSGPVFEPPEDEGGGEGEA